MKKSPLKWVGSKYKLMPKLLKVLPKISANNKFIDPFAGSATVALNTSYENTVISDINYDLICFLNMVKKYPVEMVEAVEFLFNAAINAKNGADIYMGIRSQFNKMNGGKTGQSVNLAVRFLYLNRFGFNGLCRYNLSGEFNVPYGKQTAPYIPLKEIKELSDRLQSVDIIHRSYADALESALPGDLVYCDPPYFSNTGGFTGYYSEGSSNFDQVMLASKLRELHSKGVNIVTSNSNTIYIKQLYEGFVQLPVEVMTCVSGIKGGRGKQDELIMSLLAYENRFKEYSPSEFEHEHDAERLGKYF